MTARLEFSIGPVQGFVSQSRRTRDLWGSSFLLSFLSAHAIRGAVEAGAAILTPRIENDPMMDWVSGKRDRPPQIGSIPNLFVAEVDGDPAPVARAAHRAFDQAWKRVCRAVWDHFVSHAVSRGDGTREIWDRQTTSFWEILWAAGPAEERGLLARRKHWRSAEKPAEPGDKCTVMPEFQEISGWVRTQGPEATARQAEFWEAVRARTGPLDVREDERLCAVALVKRLFVRVAEKALGGKIDRSGWPSIVYIAAVPWLRRVLEADPEGAERYADLLCTSVRPEALQQERIDLFDGLSRREAGGFASFDATVFHAGLVGDESALPLEPGADREALKEGLRRLYEAKLDGNGGNRGKVGPPPVFYALLLADGDRLGRVVSSMGGDTVGKALGKFTAAVQRIVRQFDGVTVYAGGDDVLALLPVEGALDCADALRNAYSEAFDPSAGSPSRPTLSAAIVFAHMRLALSSVISEAHRLLDEVAKDGNGRDSLAVGVLKRGGLNAQWVSAWRRPHRDGTEASAVADVGTLVRLLGTLDGEPGISSSLLYRLRESLALLCGWPRWMPGDWGKPTGGLDVEPFVHSEVLHSVQRREGQDDDEATGDVVERLTEAVLNLLECIPGGGAVRGTGEKQIGVDGLLLSRFLAGRGREDE